MAYHNEDKSLAQIMDSVNNFSESVTLPTSFQELSGSRGRPVGFSALFGLGHPHFLQFFSCWYPIMTAEVSLPLQTITPRMSSPTFRICHDHTTSQALYGMCWYFQRRIGVCFSQLFLSEIPPFLRFRRISIMKSLNMHPEIKVTRNDTTNQTFYRVSSLSHCRINLYRC